MNKILLKDGLLINADEKKQADILIEDGIISNIGNVSGNISDSEVINCKDRLIFPGLIDAHTHMGVPIKDGYSADDFVTGPKSALNGGVTTIVDFTVLEKNQSLKDSILTRQKLAKNSVIDYTLHINITRFEKSILQEIPEIIKMGFNSFKVFTTYKEAGMMLTYSQIEEVSRVLADHGGLLMIHAEDNSIIEKASRPLISRKLTEAKYHALARPAEAEEVAVENIANIAEKTSCPTYIVHLNTSKGLNIAKQCDKMYIETCPQYLLLNDSVYKREDGNMFIASPPLRKQGDCKALWEGVIDGSVDVIATDHCPFMLKDKPNGIPFQNIPNGIGGVETLFPVIFNQFIERKVDLSILTKLMSSNPAKIFNLAPQKGSILVGTDADLVVVNPNNISNDWLNKLVSITDWNAYTEFQAVFPERVICKKQLV